MDPELYGIPASIARPPTSSSPRVLNLKFANFFNEINQLAGLKSNPAQSVYNTRKSIQELIHRQISAEVFVGRLHQVFGSSQPSLLRFLKEKPSTSSPCVSTNNIVRSASRIYSPSVSTNVIMRSASNIFVNSAEHPIELDSSPELPSPPLKAEPQPSFEHDFDSPVDMQDEHNLLQEDEHELPVDNDGETAKNEEDDEPVEEPVEDAKPSTSVSASPQPPESPLEPIYIEPDYPLLNPRAILKHCNRRKHRFESITQEAVNSMADFINVEFRVFFETVMNVAKARQCTPLLDDEDDETNDVRTQVSVLDSHYLTKDLHYSTSDEAKKILASKKNRKRDYVEIQNDANDVALSALGVKKKRNWASSLIEEKPKSKNPFFKPFRITVADVRIAMEKNKKLKNSWAYRNTLYLSTAATRSPASKYLYKKK